MNALRRLAALLRRPLTLVHPGEWEHEDQAAGDDTIAEFGHDLDEELRELFRKRGER